MRGIPAFALTAITLLFLLQGLPVLLTFTLETLAGLRHADMRPAGLLLLAVPLAAMLAPALPLTRFVDRRHALIAAAIVTALAYVALATTQQSSRLVAACIVVGAGATFLSTAIGFLERRTTGGAAGGALVLDQLVRFGGWTGPWAAAVLSVAAIIVATGWARYGPAVPSEEGSIFERRAGGLRRRGALAFAILLFIELGVVGGPAAVQPTWDVLPPAAAVVLILAGAVAVLRILLGRTPIGRTRPAAVALTVLVSAAALLTVSLGGYGGLAVLTAGHVAAVLLAARVLVPGSGRRKGSALAGGLILWLLLNVAWASASPAGDPGGGGAAWIVACACAALALVLVVLPRPLDVAHH